jgi:hypothetical protein
VSVCTFASGCGVTEPRGTAGLTLTYSPLVTTLETGPPGSDECAHHYAPAQYTVETSWGARAQLARDGGGAVFLGPAQTGRSLWIRVLDVTWCRVEPVSPVARRGVRVNSEELLTILPVDGQLPALGFTLAPDGRVVP